MIDYKFYLDEVIICSNNIGGDDLDDEEDYAAA